MLHMCATFWRVTTRKSVVIHFLLHTLDKIFTLSNTQPLHYFHLNTGFLNAELQANLARNKANGINSTLQSPPLAIS